MSQQWTSNQDKPSWFQHVPTVWTLEVSRTRNRAKRLAGLGPNAGGMHQGQSMGDELGLVGIKTFRTMLETSMNQFHSYIVIQSMNI